MPILLKWIGYNIVLAVGSGELEMVTAMKSQAQDRFLGGMEFPRYTAPVNNRLEYWPEIDELRQLFESDQLQVMGEVTAQYAGVAPNDPKLEPYYALAEELDIPFCLHTGFGPPMSPYMGDPDFRMRYGNPLLLEDVLVAASRLTDLYRPWRVSIYRRNHCFDADVPTSVRGYFRHQLAANSRRVSQLTWNN